MPDYKSKQKAKNRLKNRAEGRATHLGITAYIQTEDTDSLTPQFDFSCLAFSGKQQDKARLLDSVLQRSKMTWKAIINAPKHGTGTEEISAGRIKKPIPQGFAEESKFLAMRAVGLAPMVGVRRERVFYVLWVDIDFSLYAH